MNIREGTERKVSFNTRDKLGDKIDKLTVVMSRLEARDSNEKNPSNPKYMKVEVRIGPIVKEVIKIEILGQRVKTEDGMEIIGLGKAIETTILERTLEDMEDKIVQENMGITGAMIIIGGEIGQEKGHSQESLVTIGIEVLVTVDRGLDLELVLIEIG